MGEQQPPGARLVCEEPRLPRGHVVERAPGIVPVEMARVRQYRVRAPAERNEPVIVCRITRIEQRPPVRGTDPKRERGYGMQHQMRREGQCAHMERRAVLQRAYGKRAVVDEPEAGGGGRRRVHGHGQHRLAPRGQGFERVAQDRHIGAVVIMQVREHDGVDASGISRRAQARKHARAAFEQHARVFVLQQIPGACSAGGGEGTVPSKHRQLHRLTSPSASRRSTGRDAAGASAGAGPCRARRTRAPARCRAEATAPRRGIPP